MFVNKLFTYITCTISKSKRCLNVKSSTYYFHMKTKILVKLQICISVTLKTLVQKFPYAKVMQEKKLYIFTKFGYSTKKYVSQLLILFFAITELYFFWPNRVTCKGLRLPLRTNNWKPHSQTYFKNLAVFETRFSKCVWLFWKVLHERVKNLCFIIPKGYSS